MQNSIRYTKCVMPSLSALTPLFAPFLMGSAVILLVLFLMRTRRFYFIRHGETLLNAQHIRQGEDGALSERGRAQAEQIGQHFEHTPIKRIISSTYPRARETAGLINTYLNVPILYSPLLAERRNPSEIIGKHTHDAAVTLIVNQMDLAYHPDDYLYSDEENFAALKARARKCLSLLARQGARETLVVTHHVFLKMLVAYLLYREELHATDFVKLSFFNVSDNAGITICEYNPWDMFSPTLGWKVVSYNGQPDERGHAFT